MSQKQVQERINLPEFRGDPKTYAQDLGRELQRQWRHMALVVNNIGLPYYEQATEPTISTNSLALWQDSSDHARYLIVNFGGFQGKVQVNVAAKKIVGGTLNMSGETTSSGP